MARLKIQNYHSKVKGNLPSVSGDNALEYGEIAVNYAKGGETIAIRNANDEIVTFPNSNTFRNGCTNVTTLVNVPIKTRLVYASLSADNTLSIDTSSYSDMFTAFPDGIKMKIIAYNSSSNSITITLPSDVYVCTVKSVTVKTQEYGVFDIDFKSQSEIYINGKSVSVNQESGGGDGDEKYTGEYAIVAFSNGTDYQLVKDQDNNLSDFKSAHSDYEPIGIVVIPSSCSSYLYGNNAYSSKMSGKNIIMSLCPMSCITPDNGGSAWETIYWGGYVQELNCWNVANYYSDGTIQSTVSTTSGEIYMASDYLSGLSCKDYPSIKYYVSGNYDYAPSPFKVVDNELIPNEIYYTTTYSSVNALSTFNGPYCTYKIVSSLDGQTDWDSKGVAIDNNESDGYNPAACCCARFGAPDNSSAPKGTNSFLYHWNNNSNYDYTKGVNYTWYFPSVGELGFITPHYKKNNIAIEKLKSLYPSKKIVAIPATDYISSSTQIDATMMYDIDMDSFSLCQDSNTSGLTAPIAFCAI